MRNCLILCPDIMSPWRKPKTLVITCLGLGAFLLIYVYFRPIGLLCTIRRNTWAKPEFWIVPTPLANLPIDQTPGRKFAFYGYQFEVPWTDVKRETRLKSMQLVFFSNDFAIMLWDPAQRVDRLKLLTGEGTENEAAIKGLFGEEATRSNYALLSKVLNLTPRDLQLSFSRQKMVSSSVLLMLKPMWTHTLQGGLYSFQTNWLRGFQQGDPTGDKTVTIDAFDAHDHEIKLSISRAQNANQDVTQSELNRVIFSFRPIPASQTKPRRVPRPARLFCVRAPAREDDAPDSDSTGKCPHA